MLAADAVISAIDFETTGTVEGYADQAWQIGLVRFEGGRVVEDTPYTSLLRVGDRPFNPYAPGRHAQVRSELAASPTLQELWPTLRPWVTDRPLCAHNVPTERKFLQRTFPLHPLGPWIDTLKLTRVAYPQLPSHKLEDIIDVLGLKPTVDRLAPGREPHDALYDAFASAAVLEHLLARPEWDAITLDALVV